MQHVNSKGKGKKENISKDPVRKKCIDKKVRDSSYETAIFNLFQCLECRNPDGDPLKGATKRLCPDWCDMKPKNAVQNAKDAMNLADDSLGVPQLAKPEEIIIPNVDDQSMTYLSQYPKAEQKPGTSLRPRTNQNGNVGAVNVFTVKTFDARKGNVEAFIENTKGQLQPEGHADVVASDPGLESTGVMVGKPRYFDILTKELPQHKEEQPIQFSSVDTISQDEFAARQAAGIENNTDTTLK